MESLAPPLSVLLNVRWEMEGGSSLREALAAHLRTSCENDFIPVLREWSARKSHAQPATELIGSLPSPYRRALLELFERGWNGEPILTALDELEIELHSASQSELDRFVATLPFRAMIPLLFLQFPAYLLLLLGPVLSELMNSFGNAR